MKPTATMPAGADPTITDTMVQEVIKIMEYTLVPGASWDEHRSVLAQAVRNAAEEAMPPMPPFEREARVQDVIEDVMSSDAMVFGLADVRRGVMGPSKLIIGLYQATKHIASKRRAANGPEGRTWMPL